VVSARCPNGWVSTGPCEVVVVVFPFTRDAWGYHSQCPSCVYVHVNADEDMDFGGENPDRMTWLIDTIKKQMRRQASWIMQTLWEKGLTLFKRWHSCSLI
jgi:hypothetical protein